jgi:hypothetical protein
VDKKSGGGGCLITMNIGRVKFREIDVVLKMVFLSDRKGKLANLYFYTNNREDVAEFIKTHRLWKCAPLKYREISWRRVRYDPHIKTSVDEMEGYYKYIKTLPYFKLDFTFKEIEMRWAAELL